MHVELRRPALVTLFAVLQILGAAGFLLLAAVMVIAATESSGRAVRAARDPHSVESPLTPGLSARYL
jgi:hypothetical protein